MTLNIELSEHAYNNIMAVDSITLGRTPYKGIVMSAINAIKRGEAQEPTPKNDLGIDDEERELALMYLEQIKDDYIEGVGYERYPLPEYYAIETAMKNLRKYQKIQEIIKDHDADRIPEDYWYIDKIREVMEDGKA